MTVINRVYILNCVLSWRFDFGSRVSQAVCVQNCFEIESREELIFGKLFDGQKSPRAETTHSFTFCCIKEVEEERD